MKRMLTLLLVLVLALPLLGMAPRYHPPESWQGTSVVLPLPLADAPVGAGSASLRVLPGENIIISSNMPAGREEPKTDWQLTVFFILFSIVDLLTNHPLLALTIAIIVAWIIRVPKTKKPSQ